MTDRLLIDASNATHLYAPGVGVQRMSLKVGPGEVVGLLGANGAGKTTFIRMLLGIVSTDSGTLRVFDAPPSTTSRHRTGYMPQGLGLYRDLTVAQNYAFSASAFAVKDPPPLPESLQAISSRLVGAIGLGFQRQLGFACTLIHNPDLLLLDEPTSGVDPLAAARLWDTIHEQRERGAGVLVSTHNMEEAEQCTRLVIMSGGKLVASGTGGEITGSNEAVVVASSDWSSAFTALTKAGMPVTLAGRGVRVAGTPREAVASALSAAGVEATCNSAPATLEETMVLIERSRENAS